MANKCRPPQGYKVVRKICDPLFGDEEGEAVAKTLYEEILEEGETKGLEKGKAEGKAETVTAILTARFGALPLPLKKQVLTRSDPAELDQLAILAATCPSLNEFKREVGKGKKTREKSISR